MTEFRWSGDRLDVFFSEDEDVKVAFTLLAICAYPNAHDLRDGGQANKFFDALAACLHRQWKRDGLIEQLPPGTPKRRDCLSRIDRGAENILRFGEFYAALQFNRDLGRSPITLEQSPGLDRATLTIRFGASQQVVERAAVQRKSVGELLRFHQRYFRRGGADPSEDTKTVRKRFIRPLSRMGHIMMPLYGRILETSEEEFWLWDLFRTEPVWARDVIKKSAMLAPYMPAMWSEMGVTTVSESRMIHLHG